TLWVAGDGAAPFMHTVAQRHGVALAAQAGSDLGARMAHAFDTALAHAARCVLIGTDCPAMTPAHIAQAAELLRAHDVVLQPALDGGYVLIGLRAPQPALFRDIAWGSAEVLAATRARIAARRLAGVELPPLPDLDTAADYDHARAAGWITAIEE
ncbi:MAG TPA: TIGR04282 family arsenosugar biosynthesis glycosyltransferase, partial [Burkholderiaceae bacterium]|nr:TIGR04282 family arsenosugar biosynthesis glycosyltransferase [Burkholderiaceae bacterium]